jgi:hypothetical protein
VNPNFTTIITPIKPDGVEACRQYLREHAEPRLGSGHAFLECQPLFRFDSIESLHFCSFVILEAAGDFAPSLVFEATFDGPKDDFLRQLLQAAPDGFDTVYRWCVGYPASGVVTPELVKEYFLRHDVGADTFFSGSPGRTVSQIKGEGRIREGIVSFLAARCPPSAPVAGRSSGILDVVLREFVRGTAENRWAEQPVQLPWEMTSRKLIVLAAGFAAALLACSVGALVCAAFGYAPASLYRSIPTWFEAADQIGAPINIGVATAFPLIVLLIPSIPLTALHALTGLIAVWLVVRILELVLISWSRDVRDQFFMWRFPLQLAVVARCALVAFLAGVVLFAVVSGADKLPASAGTAAVATGIGTTLGMLAAAFAQLVIIGLLFAAAWHWATSLKLEVELRPLDEIRENFRRLKLDVARFLMFILASIAVLVVASVMPESIIGGLAGMARPLVNGYFVLVVLALVGVFVAYLVGLVAMLTIGALEHLDKSKYQEPAALLERARENAKKYVRDEGGINRFQNHLASITSVKPGIVRHLLLRLALYAVNLLARFWFNQGELGGIPTILSARWVLIDKGRRLLFLDNFGGAWESYLNEFIDLAAVKGLNAIWSNTFVSAGGRNYGFPATRFLFWKGAQDARPFKAYVRESQIETLVWYGAYPTFGVVGINANTDTRQSLFEPLLPAAIDRLLQRL